jgi:hypothetical protein
MLHLYLQVFPAVPVIVKMASAPEQIGLLELSVLPLVKHLPLQLQLLIMDENKLRRYLRFGFKVKLRLQ